MRGPSGNVSSDDTMCKRYLTDLIAYEDLYNPNKAVDPSNVRALPLVFIVLALSVRLAPEEWAGDEQTRKLLSLRMYWSCGCSQHLPSHELTSARSEKEYPDSYSSAVGVARACRHTSSGNPPSWFPACS